MDYVFHFDVFRNYATSFFQACLLTFKLAGICIVFTTVFGAICGALLTSGSKVVKGVVKVYADDKLLYQRKRPVMAPGEMEQVVFQKEWLTGGESVIRVVAEEEEA